MQIGLGDISLGDLDNIYDQRQNKELEAEMERLRKQDAANYEDFEIEGDDFIDDDGTLSKTDEYFDIFDDSQFNNGSSLINGQEISKGVDDKGSLFSSQLMQEYNKSKLARESTEESAVQVKSDEGPEEIHIDIVEDADTNSQQATSFDDIEYDSDEDQDTIEDVDIDIQDIYTIENQQQDDDYLDESALEDSDGVDFDIDSIQADDLEGFEDGDQIFVDDDDIIDDSDNDAFEKQQSTGAQQHQKFPSGEIVDDEDGLENGLSSEEIEDDINQAGQDTLDDVDDKQEKDGKLGLSDDDILEILEDTDEDSEEDEESSDDDSEDFVPQLDDLDDDTDEDSGDNDDFIPQLDDLEDDESGLEDDLQESDMVDELDDEDTDESEDDEQGDKFDIDSLILSDEDDEDDSLYISDDTDEDEEIPQKAAQNTRVETPKKPSEHIKPVNNTQKKPSTPQKESESKAQQVNKPGQVRNQAPVTRNRPAASNKKLEQNAGRPNAVNTGDKSKQVPNRGPQVYKQDVIKNSKPEAKKLNTDPKAERHKRYQQLTSERLLQYVRQYLLDHDVTVKPVDRKLLDNQFGADNISKLIRKSYLISLNGKITLGF